MMVLPPQVNTAISMLYTAGYEAYLVGGAVRDYVRDNSPAKDWDITTNALPAQVEFVFSGYHLIETGLKHGTVTVMIGHEPIEITTYRIDGEYSDHRHPDSVHFARSLKDDLERRDFTMNALAYSPQKGNTAQRTPVYGVCFFHRPVFFAIIISFSELMINLMLVK